MIKKKMQLLNIFNFVVKKKILKEIITELFKTKKLSKKIPSQNLHE